jgi:hypothetical protein
MTALDRFFKQLTKQADAPFNMTAFFKTAAFVEQFDFTRTKLSNSPEEISQLQNTPITVPGQQKMPNMMKANPGNGHRQQAPSNPTGVGGEAGAYSPSK